MFDFNTWKPLWSLSENLYDLLNKKVSYVVKKTCVIHFFAKFLLEKFSDKISLDFRFGTPGSGFFPQEKSSHFLNNSSSKFRFLFPPLANTRGLRSYFYQLVSRDLRCWLFQTVPVPVEAGKFFYKTIKWVPIIERT